MDDVGDGKYQWGCFFVQDLLCQDLLNTYLALTEVLPQIKAKPFSPQKE